MAQRPTTAAQATPSGGVTTNGSGRGPAGRRDHGRAVAWLLVAATVLMLAVVGALALHRVVYAARIYPGVRVGAVDVGGLSPAEAMAAMADSGLDPDEPVVLRVGSEEWALPPEQAGVQLDARASAIAAFNVGREGSNAGALLDVLLARANGRAIPPSLVVDNAQVRRTVHAVADAYDRPARNAALAIDGTNVFAVDSVVGQAVDIGHAVEAIQRTAADGTWPIRELALPANTIRPEVASADEAVSAAQALLASPIALRDGSDAWLLSPGTLAPMLTVTNSHGSVVLGLDEGRLASWMLPVTESISQTARLPRFHYEPTYGQLQLLAPGQAQRRVDVSTTARNILAVGGVGPRSAPVAVDEVRPAVADTVTASELGIVEVIEERTSRFAGSPAERIHNIALAASQFDGVLVPPNAVFSFNDAVGDISAEAGYEETKIIMDGTTQEGVGGGVCQVSTTLFRAAFFAGLPIEERYPHGYRVAYYEQGAPPGLDATVYSPVVDLKFRNDTGAWILIETDTDSVAATTTFRFLGTRPDRQVTLEGPTIGDTTPPPEPRVEVDPTLATGESKILEHARNGASVRVTRVITTAGEELREVFASYYRPTGLVTAIGPRSEPPTTGEQATSGSAEAGAAGSLDSGPPVAATQTP